MAQEVAIPGSPAKAKVRSPLGVLGLSFITLGVYYLYWWFAINKEMAEFGHASNDPELGDNPIMSLVAISIGSIVLIPPFVSVFNTCKRIGRTQEKTTGNDSISPVLMLVLVLLVIPGIIVPALMQSNLNQAWEKGAGA